MALRNTTLRRGLATTLACAALLALPVSAFAQDGGGPPVPLPPGPPTGGQPVRPAETGQTGEKKGDTPAEEIDTSVDVKGNRYRVTLRNKSIILGVMPRGLVWEKPDDYGAYQAAKQDDKGSGIRLYYVLGLDGEIFISHSDIAVADDGKLMVRDLGVLTEAQKAEIRERVLDDRRQVLRDREVRIREELARITSDEEVGGGEEAGGGDVGETSKEEADADAKAGDALLEKFPYPDWSEQRLKDILRREIINGIFRDDQEREFIDGFKLWRDALKRKQEAEQGGQ